MTLTQDPPATGDKDLERLSADPGPEPGDPGEAPPAAALRGLHDELTLFPRKRFKVEQSEATLGGITVPVEGQFEEDEEFDVIVRVRVTNVITLSNEAKRRHILYGSALRRVEPEPEAA